MSQYFWSSFSYTAHADDTTFFLENKESVEKLVKTVTLFCSFSGLKPNIFTLFCSFLGLKSNISKCEICGLGPMKGLEIAVCAMQSVDLRRDSIKIF